MRCAHVARIHKFDARAGGGGVDHSLPLGAGGDALHSSLNNASGMLLVISIRSKQTVYTHTLDPLYTPSYLGFQYCTLIHRHNQYYM